MPRNVKFFINKVINENDVKAFHRHNITSEDIFDPLDKEVYKFILEFSKENDGNCPSYAVVVDMFPGFEYIPDITESYSWLAKRIKNTRGREMILELFETGAFEDKLTDSDITDFVRWLETEMNEIKGSVDLREKVGKSVKKDGDLFLSEHMAIKEGRSNRVIPSSFSAIDGYDTGNMFVIYGKSGRGKSVIALREAITASLAGYNVLYWGMELNWFEIMSRIYALISGDGELVKQRVIPQHRIFADRDGMLSGGFNPRDLQRGRLTPDLEEALEMMLKNLTSIMEGDIVIRAVDDPDFTHRNVDALVADIEATKADLVIVDPFYYMEYEKNTSRKTGGDAEATSKKLKMITGTHDVAIIALTQSEENENEADKDGNRELVLPKRSEVMKSSALLQDSSMLIGVDTNYLDGIGKVGLNKGRSGGEGNVSNLIFLPQYGVVKEIETGVGAMQGFDEFDDI